MSTLIDEGGSGFLCPVCGKHDFGEIGTFDICPFCQWENDFVQSSDHNFAGGPNSLSVNEARIEYFLLHSKTTQDKATDLKNNYSEACQAIYKKYHIEGARIRSNVEQESEDYKEARQTYLNGLNILLQGCGETIPSRICHQLGRFS